MLFVFKIVFVIYIFCLFFSTNRMPFQYAQLPTVSSSGGMERSAQGVALVLRDKEYKPSALGHRIRCVRIVLLDRILKSTALRINA